MQIKLYYSLENAVLCSRILFFIIILSAIEKTNVICNSKNNSQ